MKFIANENIALKTVESLKNQGIDILSIKNYGFGLKDEEVIKIAAKEHRILIMLDKDFGELVLRKGKRCEGIILLRIPPKSPEYLKEALVNLLKKNIKFENAFVVASLDKVRILPLTE
nr:DUF5615 family PIN-like protein [Candidatus Freyarchaeota archaeon]